MALNPLIEHLPEKIKPLERDAYLERHQTFRDIGNLSPTRIGLDVGAEIVAVGHELAGFSSPTYKKYRAGFSAWPAKLETLPALPPTLATLSLSLNLDGFSADSAGRSALRRLIGSDPRLRTTGVYAMNRWATWQMGFYFQDGEPAVTFSFDELGLSKGLVNPVALNALGAGLTMLFYGTVTLKDPGLAGRAMDAVLGSQSLSVPFFEAKQETYDLIAYRGFAVHALTLHLGPVGLHT